MSNTTYRIKGKDGVIIESEKYLEVPKAPTVVTPEVIRNGMFRYNREWRAFEGAIDFDDGVKYRRFANLDANGKLLSSQLPDSVTSGLSYKGTFEPVIDDIDPPRILGRFDPLPVADGKNSGDYYIVRGIFKEAIDHYNENKPTKSPVIFTPKNETGLGEWAEIKYYFKEQTGTERLDTHHLLSAFVRIIVDKVPADHEGLLDLVNDEELTKFNDKNIMEAEGAFMDGDWVVSSEQHWQHIRQTRASILATEVMFDERYIYGVNRPLSGGPAATVQSYMDLIMTDYLQRTGDAMFENGDYGSGRLALVYGTEKQPALTFNNNPYDPEKNSGVDPSKWSDPTTGWYHPAKGQIATSILGTERVFLTNEQFMFNQFDTKDLINKPTVLLKSKTNRNPVGFSALNNVFTLALDKKDMFVITPTEVNMKYSTVNIGNNLNVGKDTHGVGDLTIDGNTILGNKLETTVLVNGSSEFKGDALFDKNVHIKENINVDKNATIGTEAEKCKNTLHVYNKSIFECDITANGNMTIKGNLTVEKDLHVKGNTTLDKNVVIGIETQSSPHTVIINHPTTINQNLTVHANTDIDNNLKVGGDVSLGTDCKNKLDVKSETAIHCNTTIDKDLTQKGNTTLGTNNKNSVVVNSVLNAKDNVNIDKNLITKGNVTLGTSCDTTAVTVNSPTTIKCNTTVEGNMTANKNTTLGSTAEDTTTLKSKLVAKEDALFEKNVTIKGNTNIGTDCSSTLTINAATNVKCNLTAEKDFNNKGNTTLGTNNKNSVVVNSVLNAKDNVNIDKDLTSKGNVTVGTNESQKVIVKSPTTFEQNVKMNKQLDIDGLIKQKIGLSGSNTFGITDVYGSGSTLRLRFDSGKHGYMELYDGETRRMFFGVSNDGVSNITLQNTKANTKITLHDNKNIDITATTTNLISDVNVQKNMVIGKDCSTKLDVNSTSTFKCDAVFNKNITVDGSTNLKGNITIGDKVNPCSGVVDFYSKVNHHCDSTYNKNAILSNGSSLLFNGGAGGNALLSKEPAHGITMTAPVFTVSGTNSPRMLLVSKDGLLIPKYDKPDNTRGEDGMIAYDGEANRPMYKSKGKWMPIGATAYIEHGVKKSDWVSLDIKDDFSAVSYIKVPNPNNNKVLSIEVYEYNAGGLKKLDPNDVIIKKGFVFISVFDEVKFDGKIRIIIDENIVEDDEKINGELAF